MTDMILFSAIRLSEEAADTAVRLQEILRRRSAGNYPVKENLHVTVQYYGKGTNADIARISDILQEIPLPDPRLQFDRLLRFGGTRGDHIVYGAAENSAFQAWQNELCEACRRTGVRFDEKPFKPHITLVRGKEGRIETDDIDVPVVSFAPESPVLFESLQIKGQRVYRPVWE